MQIKITMQLLSPPSPEELKRNKLTVLSVGKDVATGALISWVWVCAMEQSLIGSIDSK